MGSAPRPRAGFEAVLEEKNVDPAYVVYLGNDINDLPCFEIAGWSVAVAMRTRKLSARLISS
jgi:3-deoxy-D-manno-octulosonate 8-phosphate phosphatase KdsC-like HAD superfamily phosphatase